MEPARPTRQRAKTNGAMNVATNGLPKGYIEASESAVEASHHKNILTNVPEQEQASDRQSPDYQNGTFHPSVDEDGCDPYDASRVDPASSVAASEEHRIQAFAKLEFADGDFYMTTYAIELGRDRQTASPVQDGHWRGTEDGSKNRSTSSAAGSVKFENDGEDSVRDSIEGNDGKNGVDRPEVIREGIAQPEEVTSPTSSSQQLSRRNSTRHSRKDYNALAMAPAQEAKSTMNRGNMDEFDLSAPLDCPLIPIQQPLKDRGRPVNKKSISRRHARISFNFDKHYFELLFLGRNGGFLDEEWFAPGDIQPLVNGSVIQIGGLGVRFILPDVPPGETGADEIENGEYNESVDAYSNEDEEDSNDEKLQEEDISRMTTRGRGKSRPEPEEGKAKSKRKGPGRPPKNGVMSKREQAQLAREARETAKTVAEKKSGTVMGRGKGKTTKALELEQTSIQPSGKRKYTKRKRANGENGDQHIRESTDMTDSAPPEQAMPTKPPKEKKPPKPPRSPSPQWDESTLTPEQLAKPQASYVVLIHEALTNSKTGAMSLPQIYRAIERKYPYFKLKVTTQGWQSSVRHNLGQHAAFRKIERDGKGWMWGYDPEVSIEKEKKRRATPPPLANPQPRYYPQQKLQQPHPNQYPYPAVHYPAGHIPPNGQLPTNGLPPMAYGQHPGMSHSPLPPRPPFVASGYPLILNPNAEVNYRSPYDPNSSAQQASQSSSHSQPAAQPNGLNGGESFPQPQPSSLPPHYPGFPPGAHNPPPTSNGLPNIPPSALHSTPRPNSGISPHALGAINKFKSALMEDMDNKEHAHKLIQSAIDRALGIQCEPLNSQHDLENEKTIMAAVRRLLQDMGEGNNDKQGTTKKDEGEEKDGDRTDQSAGENEARVNEIAKNAAKLVAADAHTPYPPPQPPLGNGVKYNVNDDSNGNKTNGLKHKRSPSTEAAADLPPGKKKSI